MYWLTAARSWWVRFRAPKPLGYRGERAAERFLKKLGYKIVARGLRQRGSELDLVAVDGRTIVFVEVKTRTSTSAGHPSEAVDDRKQRRLTRAALTFLKRHDLFERATRFDVVAITWPETARRPTIEHYIGAFEASGIAGMFS